MFGGSGAFIGKLDPLIRGSYQFRISADLVFRYFPDSFLCNICHDRFRFHGRADKFQSLLFIQCHDLSDRLSDLRSLDLGRRLAFSAWLP